VAKVWRQIVKHNEHTTAKGFPLRFCVLACGHSRRCNIAVSAPEKQAQGHVRRLCGKCAPEDKPVQPTPHGSAARWNGVDMLEVGNRSDDEEALRG
jgi:hypothetical protein